MLRPPVGGRVGDRYLPLASLVLGSAVGGVALALAVAPIQWAGRWIPDLTTGVALALVAIGIGAILWPGLLRYLPQRRRQVASSTAFRYSRVLFPFVWGIELGVGFLTFVATGGFYVVIASLIIQPVSSAILIGLVYAISRGLTIALFAITHRSRDARELAPLGFGLKRRLAVPLVVASALLTIASAHWQ